MKKQLAVLLVLLSCVSSVSALSEQELTDRINTVQGTVPIDIPIAPAGNDQKGFVGEIISGIFDPSGKLKTEFIFAFQNILGVENNIPKWNSGEFNQGTIWDVNGNIGIGNPNPTRKLDVDGDINFTGDLYKNGSLLISTGTTPAGAPTTTIGAWSSTSTTVFTERNVGIGTSNPQSMLHVTGTGRFDGGINIDGVRAISNTNASHTAQPSPGTGYSGYGFFEMRNEAGERGAYLGAGNGGNRIDLMLDTAEILYMGKTNGATPRVGIGIRDPQATLHVDGNIIASEPTAGNHLATKNYVDTVISNISTPGITLHQVFVETEGRTINAHNYCKQQGYTGYFSGMDNDNGSENILCFTTTGIDVTDIDSTTALAGGNSTSTFPTCSAGEILKHNGTEFVCGVDEVAAGGTSSVTTLEFRSLSYGDTRYSGYVGCSSPSQTLVSCDISNTGDLIQDSVATTSILGNTCRIDAGHNGGNYCGGMSCGGQELRLECSDNSGGSSSSTGSNWSASGNAVFNTINNIGIGTSSPSEKLHVNGNILATAYLYSSDVNLKEDIQTYPGLEIIKKLRGVSYNWKDTGKKDIGLIAQEVEQVIPEIVSTDSNTGIKSVQYGNLIAPLIEAIKEQQIQIDRLEQEIELLKK